MSTEINQPSFSYCDFVLTEKAHQLHKDYHNNEYGFPSRDERVQFERLVLEINQAGLSWETILKKRESMRAAYAGFDVASVAAFGEADFDRLMADPGIIRNRLKIAAAIHNAQVILRFPRGFAGWLDEHAGLDKAGWVKLFKKTFRFTGGEIVGEFLMSLGILPGAHDAGCEVGKKLSGWR